MADTAPSSDPARLRSRATLASENEKPASSITPEVHTTGVEVYPETSSDVPKDKLVNEEVVETDADLENPQDPQLKGIPPQVLRVVSLHDDPTELCLTFRYWVLATIFVAPGAFLSQMNSFRTTYAPYSVFFVQIASNYVGIWLAKVLPKKPITVPGTRWKFSMNPGPWTTKEHVLVTITTTSGAIGNLGVTPLALAELYYNKRVNAGAAIFFMLAIVWTGYSFAAIGRQILMYEPAYPWFQSLCQSALFETQKKQRQAPTKTARKQMWVFWGVLFGVTLWQFLPEFVMPFFGSLAFLCWVAPHNKAANFIGSGLGGMGFLNLTFDWANISNYNAGVNLFLSPWWTQVVLFMSYVLCCWVLMPAAQFGKLGSYHYGLQTNRPLRENGTLYPVADLVTPDNTLNQTAYDLNGPIYQGTQQLWSMFFDYASYTSAYAWIACFGYKQIRSAFTKFRARQKNPGEGINHQYADRLNILMRSYKEVPLWWYTVLFLCSFVALITCIATGNLFIPVWTYFVAVATGALTIIPMGWLFAVSNYQLPIGTFNELLYGTMLQAVSGNRNPAGASIYSSIAGDAWYRAQYMMQDQKIGHYMHVPPRAVFVSQIFGTIIGVPINYGTMRWILDSKREYLNGTLTDPAHIWTGQTVASALSTGVQYVLVGPSRLFREKIFAPLPYAFLVGAGVPVVIYTLHRLFPRAKFNLWNSTIFFSGASTFYGNISTGYFSRFLGGFVVMFWAYRYRYELWSRYNYILAAAFDAGFNLNMLLIFLCFGAAKVITMPNWWGNNADSVERCFALPDDGPVSSGDS
ncbi:hypothetical protein M409DRAFT_68072 [Zasmidium cellare ATCC 36951]|uniref:OPT superfamily oligopeptide transporter n=1 Tax=Zasmidium cellare ATCC 36951 TaxID=1080233 RepID=A0A6A6CFJ4_ZASCE|nr:uncharacterized protein M409DRAFT_68072 [Zasmidium cellare ATCC 36951]KAF2164176.1 hypothetical protein M409DRAFT_68072 [Zasmidium cellare ATCC 36951]